MLRVFQKQINTAVIGTGRHIKVIRSAFSASVQVPTPKINHGDEQNKHGFRARAALARELIRTYGFRLAMVNPLRADGLMQQVVEVENALPSNLRPLINPLVHSRNSGDNTLRLPPSLAGTAEGELLSKLLQQYCDSGIGYEFMQCTTEEEREFFINAIEHTSTAPAEDPARDLWCYEQVLRAKMWEKLLEKRYPTSKRFSLEGLEAGVLVLNTILDAFAARSVTTQSSSSSQLPRVVVGSLHRGRVNILHTVLKMDIMDLLKQWDTTNGPTYDDINMCHSTNVVTKSGHPVHISLIPTPCHLEAQDPVVNGKAYGHMLSLCMMQGKDLMADIGNTMAHSVLPVTVHGDASFCGQGIVSETLQLSTYQGFNCGGTIHVIFNNQVST